VEREKERKKSARKEKRQKQQTHEHNKTNTCSLLTAQHTELKEKGKNGENPWQKASRGQGPRETEAEQRGQDQNEGKKIREQNEGHGAEEHLSYAFFQINAGPSNICEQEMPKKLIRIWKEKEKRLERVKMEKGKKEEKKRKRLNGEEDLIDSTKFMT
jgi:hypothetical protein